MYSRNVGAEFHLLQILQISTFKFQAVNGHIRFIYQKLPVSKSEIFYLLIKPEKNA